jgi:UDP-N-acetyl-2-amino-2-deoxyglucuronate dehydrogenase
MPSYPVRLGFIGAGGWAEACLSACADPGLIAIAGVYDLSPDTAARQAAKYACNVYPSLEAILTDETLDGLVMTVPPDKNLAHVRQAVAAGKHCLVAKPIAANVAEAREMQRLSQEAGLVLMVGHQDRRRPEVREAKRLLDEGLIGQPVLFEGNFSHMGGWGLQPHHWRSHRERCPNVPLTMLGVHLLDNMQYLLGPAVSVQAMQGHVAMPVDNEDLAVQIYELESGALAYVGDSYVTPSVKWMRIHGTKGVLVVDLGALTLTDTRGHTSSLPLPANAPDPQAELMAEFARAIAEGIPPETDAEAAIRALACVQGALQSARKGRRICLPCLLADVP